MTNKKIPEWKLRRQEQICQRIELFLLALVILIFTFALGMTVSFEMVTGQEVHAEVEKESGGLYAGFIEAIKDAEIAKEPEAVEMEMEIAKEAPEVEDEPEQQWTPDDYERLAHLIYAEAGSQGYECMICVGSVVLNRIASDRYPDTIKAVINQKGQYTVKSWYMNREPSTEAYYAAEDLLDRGSQLPEWVLYQHGNGKPVKGTKIYAEINGEVFSYEERDRK